MSFGEAKLNAVIKILSQWYILKSSLMRSRNILCSISHLKHISFQMRLESQNTFPSKCIQASVYVNSEMKAVIHSGRKAQGISSMNANHPP